MLSVWTTAETPLLKRTFGATLRNFRPNVPEHQFIPFDDLADPPAPAPGGVVLVCGNKPLDALRKRAVVPKNRTLTSLREKPVPAGGGHYLITFDPFIVNNEPAKQELIDWDTRLAVRLIRTKGLDPELGDYRWVNDYQPMIDRIEKRFAKTGKAVDVSMDTETMSFYPWYPDRDIVSISFSDSPGMAEALYLGSQEHPVPLDPSIPLFDQIQWLLTSPKVKLRMANGKYDLIWIAEKWGIECTNFKFDTLLVGSLLDENRSNSLNLHAKIYTPLGGYDDCVAPGTKVCTADLRWVPVESVKPGDKLLGFDEQVEPGQRRRMRVAEAVSTKTLIKKGVRVTFDNGTAINCSFDHGFVAHERTKGNGPFTWVRARDLKIGARVMLVAPVLEADPSREAGYLAGLYDGEGYVSSQRFGLTSGISQKPGPVWDRYVKLMGQFGLGGFFSLQKNGEGVHTSKHSGWPTLQMLQMFRPERLIEKHPFDGRCVPSGAPEVRVTSVDWIGDIEVVSLQTSTHTFVAEGIASHNSFNAKFDKGKMDAVPPSELLPYAGGDTDACHRTADILREDLAEDPQLATFYIKILHPASRAFEKIERRGVLVDVPRYHTLAEEVRKVIKENQDKALALLPNKMRIKYRERIDAQLQQGKSPMLPSILKEYFFSPNGLNLKPRERTAKTGEPSMQKSHLRQFADVPEAMAMVAALTDMDVASKTLSTFIEGFLKHLRPDGRLHPTYMLFHGGMYDDESDESGTVTGRLSAKDPPFQIIPKKTFWAKKIRQCFPAPPGKVMIQLDFSQGELRVVACVANEKAMIEAYEAGLDLHAVTGARLGGVPYDEFISWKNNDDAKLAKLFEDLRQQAKAGNFGLLYGMGVEGFQAYAWANYGLRLSYTDAEKIRNDFFTLYSGLTAYHDRQREMVRMREMVRSPLGRIRHLPMIRSWDREVKSRAERQAINSPIQSCLSDMMLWAIALIDDAYPEIEIVGMIHDAMIAYVPEQDAALWAGRAQEVMSNLPFHEIGWQPVLKFPADAEAGPNLAELKPVIA